MKKTILKKMAVATMATLMLFSTSFVAYADEETVSTSTRLYLEDGIWAYAQLTTGERMVSAYAELESSGDFSITGEGQWRKMDNSTGEDYFSNSEDDVYSCEAGVYDSNKLFESAHAKYVIYSYESGVDRPTQLWLNY